MPDNSLPGGEQGGLRAYNRRMILNLIRRNGALPKAEMARLTGLSAQAVSIIVNALLKEKLLLKQRKVRGNIGQPFTPIALNAGGAFSLGIKIGRRSVEIAIIDFLAAPIVYREYGYDAPRKSQVLDLLRRGLGEVFGEVEDTVRSRIVGAGVAMPGSISGWTDVMGLPAAELQDWDSIDVAAVVSDLASMPAELINDATAACAAEIFLGNTLSSSSALYVYIGTFIGGGVVLNGQLVEGAQKNAGAIGSMPVRGPAHELVQLIVGSSLYSLDRQLRSAGICQPRLIADRLREPGAAPVFAAWRKAAVPALAQAIASAVCVVDFETVVVDAMLHTEEVEAILTEVNDALARLNLTGIGEIKLRRGSIGPQARVLGAAILPLIRQFSPDRALLVKKSPPVV